jgi:hypothetical protein
VKDWLTVVRERGRGYEVDILEPQDDSRMAAPADLQALLQDA